MSKIFGTSINKITHILEQNCQTFSNNRQNIKIYSSKKYYLKRRYLGYMLCERYRLRVVVELYIKYIVGMQVFISLTMQRKQQALSNLFKSKRNEHDQVNFTLLVILFVLLQ